jgi:hypothetical protein
MDAETAAALLPSERIGNYFVVIGAKGIEHPEPLEPHQLGKFITDIIVLNPKYDELSEDYDLVTVGKGGSRLDLKASRMFKGSLLVAVEYNGQRDPITDIIVCVGDTPAGYEALIRTPADQEAYIGTKNKAKIYLAVRRAPDSPTVITSLSTVTVSKKDPNPTLPGEAFVQCDIPLTHGAYSMNHTYLVYERKRVVDDRIQYKAHILDRYPVTDYSDSPFLLNAASFCLPEGLQVELFDVRKVPMPKWYPFVLTEQSGRRIYGASLVFWEPILNNDAKGKTDSVWRERSGEAETMLLHKTKCIAVMSHHAYFSPFKKILQFLYRLSLGQSVVPIERYISHFLGTVPSPPVCGLHEIDWRLGAGNKISFARPAATQLPLVDLSFLPLFHMLDPNNVAKLLCLFLLEKKVLLCSTHMPLLCYIAEAVRSLMFPIDYHGVYIPMCSHELAAVLDAPVPFVIGMNSEYVSRLVVPRGVWCVDLDTNSMHCSEVEGSSSNSNKTMIENLFLEMRPVKRFVLGMTRQLKLAGVKADGNWSVIDAFQTSQEGMLASTSNLSVDNIRNEALKMMTEFLRTYRTFLNTKNGKVTCMDDMFDKESFLVEAKIEYQPFLEGLVLTQCFGAFIQERTFPSSHESGFVFFDECLDLDDEERGKRASESQTSSRKHLYKRGRDDHISASVTKTYEELIRERLDAGVRSIQKHLKRRKSLGFSREVKVTVFEGPSKDNLPENKVFKYIEWPAFKPDLFLPKMSVIRVHKEVTGGEVVAARTESELIECLTQDKLMWQSNYSALLNHEANSKEKQVASSRAEILLKHFFGVYGMCLSSSLALDSAADSVETTRFEKSLQNIWKRITKCITVLDEATYRSLLIACGYFGKDGRSLGRKIFNVAEEILGRVSAITYSQYSKVRANDDEIEEDSDEDKEPRGDEPYNNRSAQDTDSHAWVLMWCKQNCPKCKYRLLDEGILNRFEDSGLAHTISCPCCNTSLTPKLFIKSFVSEDLFEKLRKKKRAGISTVDDINKTRKGSAPSRRRSRRSSSSVNTDSTMTNKLKAVRTSLLKVEQEANGRGSYSGEGSITSPDSPGSPSAPLGTVAEDVSVSVEDNESGIKQFMNSNQYRAHAPEKRGETDKESGGFYHGTLTGSGVFEKLSVTYMSLFRLRSGLEAVLRLEGHSGFNRARLRVKHPELYWNLIWYSRRLELDIPLPSSQGDKVDMYSEVVKCGWSVANTKAGIALSLQSPLFSLHKALKAQFSPHRHTRKVRNRAASSTPTAGRRLFPGVVAEQDVLNKRKATMDDDGVDSHKRYSKDDFVSSDDEDNDRVHNHSNLLRFNPNIKTQEEAWRKKVKSLMEGGFYEEAIESFLQLRNSGKLLWPSAKDGSIYEVMREIYYGVGNGDASSTCGKPPNTFKEGKFELEFGKALGWLSPQSRDELTVKDTCGAGLKEQILRWSFGALV